jgi:N-acetylglucosamine kinase-like BadF-type ATPase
MFDCLYEIYNQKSVYSHVASFAPIVFEAFKQGDEVAKRILHETAEYSASLLRRALETYEASETTVVLTGSLCRNEEFLTLLREKLPTDLNIKIPDYPSIYGACLLCCRLCGVDSETVTERFMEEYGKALQEKA